MLTTTGAVSPVSVSPMRSPRKVSTSNWMPGNFFRMSRIFVGHLLLFLAGHGFELHVELAAVRAPGVFAQLGAAHLLFDGGDVLVSGAARRRSACRSAASPAARCPGRRTPGGRNGLRGTPAGTRRRRTAAASAAPTQISATTPMIDARPAGDEPEHAAVAGLQPALQARLLGLAHAFVEEQIRQRRRERQRHQQRGQDGQDVAQAPAARRNCLAARSASAPAGRSARR